MVKGIQFVVDEHGEKTAVVKSELWEDFYDRALADRRQGDPRESLESVKERLQRGKRRRRI